MQTLPRQVCPGGAHPGRLDMVILIIQEGGTSCQRGRSKHFFDRTRDAGALGNATGQRMIPRPLLYMPIVILEVKLQTVPRQRCPIFAHFSVPHQVSKGVQDGGPFSGVGSEEMFFDQTRDAGVPDKAR